MDFDLSKPQTMLQDSVREFLARACPPERVRELMAGDTAFDEALWLQFADQGWLALTLPEEQGGLGLGAVDLAVVSELRDICGRVAELVDLFAEADIVLDATLQATLIREALDLETVGQDVNDG